MVKPQYRVLAPGHPFPDLRGLKLPLVIDTETSGFSPHHGHRLCGFGLCSATAPEVACYFPVRHVLGGNLDLGQVLSWLRGYTEDPAISWVMHNAVFDLAMFRADGIEFAGRVTDTMVLAHGVKPDRGSYALDALTKFQHVEYEKLAAHLKTEQRWKVPGGYGSPDYSRVPVGILGPYCCEDVVATGALFRELQHVLKCNEKFYRAVPENQGNPAHSLRELLTSDQELVRALFEIEWAGIRIDLKAVMRAKRDAVEREKRAYAVLVALSGGQLFSPRSKRGLGAAFERAGGVVRFWMLPKDGRGKQKSQQFTEDKAKSTGVPCWNSAALLGYLARYHVHPEGTAYRFLVQYRVLSQLERLISTYLDAYLRATDCRGFLHGRFHPCGTRTGRLSSSSPNLQNVCKSEMNAEAKAFEKYFDWQAVAGGGCFDDFRSHLFYRMGPLAGRKREAPDLARQIRSFFIARPGNVVVSIDYSSVEYRVAAYLTGDPELIRRFRENPDLDYHQYCADLCKITRSTAKTVNFGTLYGMGDAALASVLHVSLEKAKQIRRNLYGKLKALPRLMETTRWAVLAHGRVQNPLGRVCRVDKTRSYVGLNYKVQGCCGDIMRRALVRVHRLIRERGWDVLLGLTVHDEIVLDMPPALVPVAVPEIVRVMTDVPEIGLPLTCDVEVGRSWGQMVPWQTWLGQA